MYNSPIPSAASLNKGFPISGMVGYSSIPHISEGVHLQLHQRRGVQDWPGRQIKVGGHWSLHVHRTDREDQRHLFPQWNNHLQGKDLTQLNVLQLISKLLQEKRSYTFDPEHSNGYRYDPVIVPNIPLTSGLEMIKNSGFLEGWAIKSAITSFSQPLFLRLPADSFLWGYEDSFVNFAKLTKPMPFDQFGVLVLKNRTSDDIFRISSGDKDFNQIGVIESLNGETEMEFWKTDKCGRGYSKINLTIN